MGAMRFTETSPAPGRARRPRTRPPRGSRQTTSPASFSTKTRFPMTSPGPATDPTAAFVQRTVGRPFRDRLTAVKPCTVPGTKAARGRQVGSMRAEAGTPSSSQSTSPEAVRTPRSPAHPETRSPPTAGLGPKPVAFSRGRVQRVSPVDRSKASIRAGSRSTTRHSPFHNTGEAVGPLVGSRFTTSRCQSSSPSQSKRQTTDPIRATNRRPSVTGVASQWDGDVRRAEGEREKLGSILETSRRHNSRPSVRERQSTEAENSSGWVRKIRSSQTTGLAPEGRERGTFQALLSLGSQRRGNGFPWTTPSPAPRQPGQFSALTCPQTSVSQTPKPNRRHFQPPPRFRRKKFPPVESTASRKMLITRSQSCSFTSETPVTSGAFHVTEPRLDMGRCANRFPGGVG
jgi:hypothetical protein